MWYHEWSLRKSTGAGNYKWIVQCSSCKYIQNRIIYATVAEMNSVLQSVHQSHNVRMEFRIPVLFTWSHNSEYRIQHWVSSIDTTTMRGWNSALGFLQLKPPRWEDRIQHFGILQSKQPQWGDGIQHCSAVSSLPRALSKAEIQQLWTQLDSFTFQCRTWPNLLCLQHVQQMWSLAQKTEIGNLDQREYRNS